MMRSRKPRDKFHSRPSLISYSLFTSAPCSCYEPWINFAALASGSGACCSYYSAQHLALCTDTGSLLDAQCSAWFYCVFTLARSRARIETMRATIDLSSLRYSISFMCESGYFVRTPLMKHGVVIAHLLILCAASSSEAGFVAECSRAKH
jgi:hypothetical protein